MGESRREKKMSVFRNKCKKSFGISTLTLPPRGNKCCISYQLCCITTFVHAFATEFSYVAAQPLYFCTVIAPSDALLLPLPFRHAVPNPRMTEKSLILYTLQFYLKSYEKPETHSVLVSRSMVVRSMCALGVACLCTK